MSAVWWVLIGLAIWLAVSIPVALLAGRWLRNASQAREQADYPVSNVRPLTLSQIPPDPAADLLPRQEHDTEGDDQ